MPGIARQFEPQITRIGGSPAKYRFTARCSQCGKADTFEASKPTGDTRVKGYFTQRGWLLGRDQAYDLCPTCLGKPRAFTEPRSFTEVGRHKSSEAGNHSDSLTATADKRTRDIADILARHLGKPEELAAEVFRAKPVQTPRPPAPEAPQQGGLAPVRSPELEQALTGMAVDLKSLRTAMELIAEQLSKLVALGGQQIEAIARLAPVMAQSTDRMSNELKNVVRAVTLTSNPPNFGIQHQSVSLIEPRTEEDQKGGSEPEPAQRVQPVTSVRRTRRPRATVSTGHKSPAVHVAVRSIADANRPDRFYTTIRLSRELWDRAGFEPEDRIQLDWKKKTISIRRVPDGGGVKPKTIGDTVVVLQSWRLGDLTFDPTKIASGNGVLRLTSP
ncbi:hypothetical protein ACFOYU_04085 [Microvirga sp. GCM10011540]|uniref:hypothetical protein n=1 Tax=Microvirga sp. GCM10011540 TaxID=3317338 RepID=UPI003616FAE0